MAAEIQRTNDGAASPGTVPKWVTGKVLPATGAPAEAVQVLRNKAHKSAVVFARGRTFVAEKPLMRSPRIYEVYFPENYVIGATECPHCHERIEAPFRRVEVRRRGGTAAETAPAPTAAPASTSRVYEGKVYDVVEVEGIGETFVKRLEPIGVKTTRDLLVADASDVAKAAEVSPTVAEKWQSMAELMQVKGVGKQFAELLVRTGVRSIDELKAQQATPLLKRLEATETQAGVTIQGANLSKTLVSNWIREAKRMKRRPVT